MEVEFLKANIKGAIIRNEVGEVVCTISGPVGIATNNVAEISALEARLQWCVNNGVVKLVIEGDSQVAFLEETLEEQVERLFKKENKREKETIVDILGPDYWYGGHVYDRKLMEDLFQPIIHVLGHVQSANGILHRTVEKGIYLEVMRAMDGIVSNPADGCMLGYLNL
ncbi:hypothetical protein SUGI_0490040 [Cryptomeria japonica]|nr:hypothetical protein SUGI_0490040 [Cryptomeria japonica]